MKKTFFCRLIVITCIFALTPLAACAQTRILSQLPSAPSGVEKVYLSKAMLNMGSHYSIPFKYGNFVGDIEGLEKYECTNKSMIPSVKKQIDDILKNYYTEVLVETEEGGEISKVLALFDKENHEDSLGMAIVEYTSDEVNIVILHGKLKTKP